MKRTHDLLIALALALMVFALSADRAAAGAAGCLYVYTPTKSAQCTLQGGCNGCPYLGWSYIYPHQVLDCETGELTGACGTAGEVQDWTAWHNANMLPNLQNSCNNPWSAVYIGCNALPEPKDCCEPVNHSSNSLGDPVDVTTGALEQTATDLDLGRGLTFKRHYASDRAGTSAVGQSWEHNLDWKIRYQVVHSTDPLQELVLVMRPLATNVAFVRLDSPATGWVGGTHGAGGLSGDASSGFTYIDDDGTRVRFDGTLALAEIQHRGEPAITVTHAGATTTFASGGASLVVTESTSGTNAGRIQSISGGGQTWTYGYDGAQCLRTATGPNPSNPSQTATWTYVYPTSTGNCSSSHLTQVLRSLNGGTAVQMGAWTFVGERVTAMDERSLDQSLSLSYTLNSQNDGTTTVQDSGASTLATFTCDSGRITNVAGLGGPGVDVPFADATFTAASSNGAPQNLWQSTRDAIGRKTWFTGYDSRGRPATKVEGWIDANSNDVVDPGEYQRRRDFTYHAKLADPLTVTEKSMLNPAANRVETNHFDANDRRDYQQLDGFTLDANGAVVPLSDRIDYTYDGNGRLTVIAGPRPEQRTEIDYDPASGSRSALRRYLNGAGSAYLSWSFSNFDTQGNPQTITDPNGRATAFTYDGLGRVLTATPPYEGSGSTTVSFTYDIDGNLTHIAFPPDTAGGAVFLDLGYDAQKPSLLRFIADSKGNAIVYTYEKGRVTREERYTGFTSLASPGTQMGDASFGYDDAGRLVAAFNPLFSSGSASTAFAHDAKGNVTGISDENANHAPGALDPLRKDTLGYDALDRLQSISQVRTATYTTSFAYDALSNVTGVTDAANKPTDLLHDDRGNLVETVSPDTGTTRFLYDAAGNLVRKIEDATPTGAKRTTLYSYDGLNRLTQIDFANDPDWIFTYDTDAAKNQKGRLASVSNSIVTTQLEYTQRGDVAVERTIVDGLAYAVQYQYDASGNRKRITGPTGSWVETSYAGLRPSLLSVVAGLGAQQVTDLAWYPFGPRMQAKFPPSDGTANTVVSTRTVNLRGQITELDVTSAGTPLLGRSYVYNLQGGGSAPNDPGPNLDEVEDHLDATESRYFFYDELDRLQKATALDGTVLHQYGYDAVGNRTSKLGPLGSSTYNYEASSDRLDVASGAEARDYAHDAYGNRIYDGAAAFAGTPSLVYDESNRLVTVRDPANGFATLATYTYDAFGRRVKKVTATKTLLFLYDTQGHLAEEIDKVGNDITNSNNDKVRTYVFLEDELLGVLDEVGEVGSAAWSTPLGGIEIEPPLLVLALSLLTGLGVAVVTRRMPAAIATASSGLVVLLFCAGTPRPAPRYAWIHTDPLGTPFAATNVPAMGNAVVVWRAKYEPFGKATVDENPDGDSATFTLNVRFRGQYADAETGWHYNLYRTYDPSVGRYLEVDPLGVMASINVFEYAHSNPARFVDQLGLQSGLSRWIGIARDAAREGRQAVQDLGLGDAWRGGVTNRMAAEDATAASGLSEFGGPRNAFRGAGPANAYLHCVWACLNARTMDTLTATLIARNHEDAGDRGGQSAAERAMDERNNAVGRECGTGKLDCATECWRKLREGKLFDLGGVPLGAPPAMNPNPPMRSPQ